MKSKHLVLCSIFLLVEINFIDTTGWYLKQPIFGGGQTLTADSAESLRATAYKLTCSAKSTEIRYRGKPHAYSPGACIPLAVQLRVSEYIRHFLRITNEISTSHSIHVLTHPKSLNNLRARYECNPDLMLSEPVPRHACYSEK